MNKAPQLFKFQWLVGLILITSMQKTSILKQVDFIGTLSCKYVTVGSLLKCQVHNVSKWSVCACTCVCVCVLGPKQILLLILLLQHYVSLGLLTFFNRNNCWRFLLKHQLFFAVCLKTCQKYVRSYCWVDCPRFCKPGPVLPPHSQPPGLWILEQLEEEKSGFSSMRSPQGGKSMLCYEIATHWKEGGVLTWGISILEMVLPVCYAMYLHGIAIQHIWIVRTSWHL